MPEPSPEFAFNHGRTAKVFKLDESGYSDSMTATEKTKYIKEAKAHVDWDMAVDQPYIQVYDSKKGKTDVFAH